MRDAILFHVTRTTRELCAAYASVRKLKSVKNQLLVKNSGHAVKVAGRAWRPRMVQQPQAAAGQFASGHFVRRYKKGADTELYSADVCPMTGR